MKKAIEFLRSLGHTVDENGNISSLLPEGEAGLSLRYELEEKTQTDKGAYIIVANLLTFQEF